MIASTALKLLRLKQEYFFLGHPVYIYTVAFWLTKCQRSARYHIDRANSIVFTSKSLPLQPVSSERNHEVADKFGKMSCLNVYGRKRGRVGVKQCMHSFHSFDCVLSVFFFDDYMSKLFPIFYLAKFCLFLSFKIQSFSSKHKLHLFYPPVYEIDCFNTDQVMSKSCLLYFSIQIYFQSSVSFEYLLWLKD